MSCWWANRTQIPLNAFKCTHGNFSTTKLKISVYVWLSGLGLGLCAFAMIELLECRVRVCVCNSMCHNWNIVSLYLHKLNVYNDRLEQFMLCLSDWHNPHTRTQRWNGWNETTKNDNTNSILNCGKFPLMSPKFIYYMNNNTKRRRRLRRKCGVSDGSSNNETKNDYKRRSHTQTSVC